MDTGQRAILIAESVAAWASMWRTQLEAAGWTVVRLDELFGLSLLVRTMQPTVMVVDSTVVDETWPRRVDAMTSSAPGLRIIVFDPGSTAAHAGSPDRLLRELLLTGI